MDVALLHGFAGDPFVWDDVRATRSASGTAVRRWLNTHAIALPGHFPGAGEVRATWDDNLEAIGDAIVHACVGTCDVVVGYSLGARVALGLVAIGRAPRAILIGVNPGLPDDDLAARAERRASDAAWASLLRMEGTAAFMDAWYAQPLFATRARAPADRRAARRARRDQHDAEQLARSLEVMGLAEMPDYHAAVAAHAGSLALIAGADDAKYVALSRALVATSPALALELIADSGHDPTLEQPAALSDAIARVLTPWFPRQLM